MRKLHFVVLLSVLTCLSLSFGLNLNSRNRNHDQWFTTFKDTAFGVNLDSSVIRKTLPSILENQIVKVAIIDGGFDLTHPDYKDLLWTNPAEVAGNGKDDDKNGFADDIHGWNFLGSSDGKDIFRSGKAEYREYQRLRPKYLDADTSKLSSKERAEYAYWKKMEVRSGFRSYEMFGAYLSGLQSIYDTCDSLMRLCFDLDTAKIGDFYRIDISDTTGLTETVNSMAMLLLGKDKNGLWKTEVSQQKEKHEEARRNIASVDDPLSDSQRKVGNDPDDIRHLRGYGNNHVYVNDKDAFHGTMVAGLIAGISQKCSADVNLMGIRAVPEGDEYDRDIAAAIKYAVDNGAKVINCSFGKYVSNHPEAVVKQLKRAARKDVLLVFAAGNEGLDTKVNPVFPSGRDNKGRRFKNILIVGASDSEGRPLSGSNYSSLNVDVFAPGEDITSSAPRGNHYTASGTSLAAPIVTGIAASLRFHYPSLSAAQVAELLRSTAVSPEKEPTDGHRSLEESCVSSGVVSAKEAFEKERELTDSRRK